MTTNVNLDLWHNAGYVLGILTEAMPVGEVSLTRVKENWVFLFRTKIQGRPFSGELTLRSTDLMKRAFCEMIAEATAFRWNKDLRRVRYDNNP